jgi:DNA-directed RNA polymerase specialized sigma24 family protein
VQNGVSKTTLAAMIVAALTDSHAYHNQRFGLAVVAYAGRICRARAPDLPDDLVEDVAQEAMVNLFTAGASALTTTRPLKLLRHAVLAGIRKVRADHAPPGQRTRRYREEPRERIAAEDADRIPDAEAVTAATIAVGDHSYIDVDRFACPGAQRALAGAEQRVAIETALAKMPPSIAQALHLIHLDERPISEVAMLAGISRFVLHRRIDHHCAMFRLAA